MIPLHFLRNMGVCNLNLDGITIQAKVVDNEELANDVVAELRSRLHDIFPIVGFDLKCTTEKLYGTDFFRPKLLVLYVKDRCLLLQLGRMSTFPGSVLSLLKDQTICFLGLQVSKKLQNLRQLYVGFPDQVLKTGVDIGTFAARALLNPELEGCVDLVRLATKAGLPRHDQKASQTRGFLSRQVSNNPDWGALCFTQEEVKFALENAYVSYRIGTKLMCPVDLLAEFS